MITLNISKDFILCIVVLIACFLVVKQIISLIFQPKHLDNRVTLDSLEENKNIVNKYIERIFCETLYYFLNKDVNFDEKSPVKLQSKFKYRNCIKNLMRPDIKIDGLSFKSVFMQRIYLIFVSEVPSPIKNLIYTFNSGYDINNYWSKRRKQSISLYVFSEINNLLNRKMMEIVKNEELAYNNLSDKNNYDSIEKSMDNIDANEYTKLCSFIYGINEVSSGDETNNKPNEGVENK